jgi:hypothetical protein
MSYPHDPSYTWAFPRLPVVMHAVAGTAMTESLAAEIDTGADMTLIPVSYLQYIQAEEIYTARLRGHWGNAYPVNVYFVDLDVAGQRLPGIEVIGDPHNATVLLGRNVLNRLNLLIAGPEQRTALLSAPTTARLLRESSRDK